jgi:heme A synthase
MSTTQHHDTIVVFLHQGFARVVLIYSLLLALWGLFLYFRRQSPSGGYLGALILDEGVIILQSLIGIVLYGQGYRPGQTLHLLYGLAVFLTIPTAYLWAGASREGPPTHRDSLVFGLACLLLFGLSIRAATTGPS